MWRVANLVLLCLVLVPSAAHSVASTAPSDPAPVSTPAPIPAPATTTAPVPPAPEVLPMPKSPAIPVDVAINRVKPTLKIDVHYPVIGNAVIDADIKDWATQLADNFETEFVEEGSENRVPYELSTTYTLLRPTPDTAVTVVWEVASYTQGAHGNVDIVTSIYSLPSGEPLGVGDLFTDLGTALNLLSERAYAQLSRTLGDMLDEDMLRGGTSPDPDNFSSVALIPGAIRVFFQPYQVAPWAAGSQSVDIPLQDLEDAGPILPLWYGAAAGGDPLHPAGERK